MQSKADIILNWYEEVWVKGNRDKISQLYRPASVDQSLIPEGSIPVAESHELVSVLTSLVSDLHVQVVHTVEQGDWVSAMVEIHGCKVDTDIPVFVRWQTMVRVEGDVIVESYPAVNFLSFFEQLGQLPENSFELLLSGTVLR